MLLARLALGSEGGFSSCLIMSSAPPHTHTSCSVSGSSNLKQEWVGLWWVWLCHRTRLSCGNQEPISHFPATHPDFTGQAEVSGRANGV